MPKVKVRCLVVMPNVKVRYLVVVPEVKVVSLDGEVLLENPAKQLLAPLLLNRLKNSMTYSICNELWIFFIQVTEIIYSNETDSFYNKHVKNSNHIHLQQTIDFFV